MHHYIFFCFIDTKSGSLRLILSFCFMQITIKIKGSATPGKETTLRESKCVSKIHLQARLNDGILKVGVNPANEVVESLAVDALFFNADEHAMMLIALQRAVRQHLLEDIAEISQDVGVGQN